MVSDIAMKVYFQICVQRGFQESQWNPLDFAWNLQYKSGSGYLQLAFVVLVNRLDRLMNIFPISPSHSSVINIVETMHMPQFSAVRQDWKFFHVSAEMHVSTFFPL